MQPPQDLTTSLLTDIGWFSDPDGVPDGRDACIGSPRSPTVEIGPSSVHSRARRDVVTIPGEREERVFRREPLRADPGSDCKSFFAR